MNFLAGTWIGDWLTGLGRITLLSRELRYGSHDPAVWRALSAISDDEAIAAEVDARTSEQLRAALI